MVIIIGDPNIKPEARQMAGTIFKNTILNTTRVRNFKLQEEEMEGLWYKLNEEDRNNVKEALFNALIDNQAII